MASFLESAFRFEVVTLVGLEERFDKEPLLLPCDMQIPSGCAHVLVTKHSLDRDRIYAAFKQVRGKGVA